MKFNNQKNTISFKKTTPILNPSLFTKMKINIILWLKSTKQNNAFVLNFYSYYKNSFLLQNLTTEKEFINCNIYVRKNFNNSNYN